MTPLEMIQEWRKGCSCATPDHPEECRGCTRALIDALEGVLKQQVWSKDPPKEDGCYWLRRDSKEDTIVRVWNSAEGMVEFGATVSWLGSDWSSSLCEVVKERGCLWLGPIPHPDASSNRR